eukprot:g1455.t1
MPSIDAVLIDKNESNGERCFQKGERFFHGHLPLFSTVGNFNFNNYTFLTSGGKILSIQAKFLVLVQVTASNTGRSLQYYDWPGTQPVSC